jgi:hypothetical protein
MNRFAVLAEGFERLSYPLGRRDAAHGQEIEEQGRRYVLCRAESEQHAEMAVGASDWVANHSSEPVGFVCGSKGEFYLVCRNEGRRLTPGAIEGMGTEERLRLAVSVVRRLSMLHSQGIGCGGLRPSKMEFRGREAKLSDPSTLFTFTGEDGHAAYFEAVATLSAVVSEGLASANDLERLSLEYLRSSPVCRQAVSSYLGQKKSGEKPHRALAKAAIKYTRYL